MPSATMNSNDGLILYYHHHSFYCQKVIMALCEKRIPFSLKFIDITRGEQYQPWFLKINPQGEVPVLQDGIKLIPNAEMIIDYLEDNFSNGEHTRLIPIDGGVDFKNKIVEFQNDIDRLPVNVITVGSFFHNELCVNRRYPFMLSSVRRHLKACAEKSSIAAKSSEAQHAVSHKGSFLDENLRREKSKYIEVLDKVSCVLEKIENELASHGEKGIMWLCSNQFTVADVSLTILLDRLSRLGLENYFWSKGKRVNIEKYYHRVQRRESYRSAVPTVMTDLKNLIRSKARFMMGLLTIVSIVIGSVLYLKNN